MSIQSKIEASFASLSKSETRVADVIRSNPSVVLNNTIGELATLSGASATSVVRFCHAIGMAGYSQLRIELAQELGKEAAQYGDAIALGADIAWDDDLAQAIGKIASLEKLAIEETAANFDPVQVERVAYSLDKASRVILFGIGASFLVAEDFQLKLLRIGRNAFCARDSHQAWELACLSTPDTVAIGFSHSGETQETVRFLRLAANHNSATVAVTSVATSSIASAADEVMVTAAREPMLRAGAMVSRIAQLVTVDILFLAVARLRREDTLRALWLTRQAAQEAPGSPRSIR